jgi:hypothetical protein
VYHACLRFSACMCGVLLELICCMDIVSLLQYQSVNWRFYSAFPAHFSPVLSAGQNTFWGLYWLLSMFWGLYLVTPGGGFQLFRLVGYPTTGALLGCVLSTHIRLVYDGSIHWTLCTRLTDCGYSCGWSRCLTCIGGWLGLCRPRQNVSLRRHSDVSFCVHDTCCNMVYTMFLDIVCWSVVVVCSSWSVLVCIC